MNRPEASPPIPQGGPKLFRAWIRADKIWEHIKDLLDGTRPSGFAQYIGDMAVTAQSHVLFPNRTT
jgi:hypothetical protein